MDRLKLILIVVLTAVVSAALTSAFWIIAFNHGPVTEARAAPATVPEPSFPPPPLTISPSGLAIPVAGVRPEQLVDTYSDARANGRVHDATDIMAARGTAVVAAAPGTVEKLFFSHGGGGITAYVRSPDGQWQYYYAHLDSYAPGLHEGQKVKQGDPIGRVGATGDASASAPHLHFAINRMQAGQHWWQGTPINPYPLLTGKQ
jgi:murein DD-endopeptidase MepM/ murein hydrolase activator NlpD